MSEIGAQSMDWDLIITYEVAKSFQPNDQRIFYQGDAFAASGVIQLTKNQLDTSLNGSVGRATYAQPIHLWDSETGNLTDFNTQFSFNIINLTTDGGDGLAFFLSPFDVTIPNNSAGGYLGLFNGSLAFNHTNNQIVAVEFDTFQNPWDPSSNHVGIDVNSIVSVANVTWNTSMKNGTTANAWVNYNSTTTTLSVYLTYAKNPVFQGNYTLSYVVNLTKVLPEWVSVGFSAATGAWIEIHNIVSWSFNSTLGGSYNSTSGPPPSTSNNSTLGPPPSTGTGLSTGMGHKMIPRLVIGLAVIIGTLSCGVGLFWFMKRQKINSRGNNEMGIDASTDDDDDDFEKGTGPRRFTFRELTVKRISKGSKQGKKEYKSEVKTISRLRHRNLPVECNGNLGEVVLLEWVWSLYGKGQLLEVVDKDLAMEYDKHQVERLMLVGLWCCYPDFKLRPSIRQAINTLKFEAPLPVLPSQMPVPIYFSPSMCMPSYTSSVVTTDSDINDRIQCSSSSLARGNYSSLSVESFKAHLQLHEDNEDSILV
ncbi:hypothetical protein RHSIM_Rhsim08G0018100 [Rhododendron simsii]|uniref:Legume lectin domain-containing protein n=1 Tax=Rhododendron simsii TaxID=118357 RepID=A0A834GPX9_RHOSS|nr:hypothetical protein RHSIM_Rhsim08G0018100 [Rhododendron simsii]